MVRALLPRPCLNLLSSVLLWLTRAEVHAGSAAQRHVASLEQLRDRNMPFEVSGRRGFAAQRRTKRADEPCRRTVLQRESVSRVGARDIKAFEGLQAQCL